LVSAWHDAKAIDVLELGGIEPCHFFVQGQMRNGDLQCVLRATAVGDPEEDVRINLMALRPATPGALDDRAGIDENTV
jgi:hypothetical protein